MPGTAARIALIVLCLASFVFTTTVNRAAGALAARLAPGRLAWLPESCMASRLAALVVYVMMRPARPFAGPVAETPWPALRRLGARWLVVWLVCLSVAALVRRGWFAYAHGAGPLVGFVLLGPLGEELLFRGAIFELTERAFPAGPEAPLLISTGFFALHHFQLHGYRADAAALTQVGFTLPMGLVFGRLREWSRSLWPGFAVHVLTNLPSAFGA